MIEIVDHDHENLNSGTTFCIFTASTEMWHLPLWN